MIKIESPCAPCPVRADEMLLSRALTNLLENAVRYTPAGGHIRIMWTRETSQARFTVADSRSGIADHDMPYLFKPLYRTENSRNRQTDGAGLGLTIARRILQTHGGDLVAANREQGDAEFTGSFRDV